MFKTLKRAFTSGKASKTQRVLKLLETGKSVSWKTLRTRFDLRTPRAMIDKLRAAGNMIYINKTAQGTSYRVGKPSKAIIAAGIKKLYGTSYAYNA
jgi:ribonucleotide monophosphatase NagD (HAD superfamily)